MLSLPRDRTYGDDGGKYLRHLKKTYGTKRYAQLLQKIDPPDYLVIHMAAQKITQCDGVPMFPCDIAEDGPYALLVLDDWVEKDFAKRMLKKHTGPVAEMIKLGSTERDAMDRLLKKNKPHPQSLYSRLLL